jgi:Zn-finger nucleic acid-binding protein
MADKPKRADDSPMQCPRCIKKMRKQKHLKAVIDHCAQCSGNFFDEGEMLAVLGRSADPEIWARSNRKRTPSASDIHCPRCHKRMQLHPLGEGGVDVDIDLCVACGGIWLDGGEVDTVMQLGARALAASAKVSRAAKAKVAVSAKVASKAKAPTQAESGPEAIGKFLRLFSQK